jgi:2,4'-dihydroxyacetophenone dioxygenase
MTSDTAQRTPAPEPADPLQTSEMPWIETGPGKSFRPLRFAGDGWSELMRVEPGSVVGLHRHTGPVHALTLSGTRRILGSDEIVGPGDYVYEPGGMVDGWEAVGDEPCVIHFQIEGAVEFLDEQGEIRYSCDSATQRAVYLTWCREANVAPAPQVLAGVGESRVA